MFGTVISQVILLLGAINFFRLSLFSLFAFAYDLSLKLFQLRKAQPGSYRKNGKKSYYTYRPRVSIVIAAFNEEKVIYRTLESLFLNTYSNFEVIVVNDGSKDNTESEVNRYISDNPSNKVIYVKQENAGKAHALNHGMTRYASGKLLMSLDADSIMTSDAIANAVNYFRNRNVKALAANVKIIPDFSFWGISQKIEYLMGHHYKKALTVGNIEYIVGGVGSVFRASVLKKVGYYDTNTITEDIDLTMKIVKLGNKKNRVIYAEDVVAYTEGVMSGYALFRQRFRWKLGRFQTFWKNRDLFFNADKKYTKFLTFIYLPFQLFSEFAFLFDPLFIGYVLYLAMQYATFSTYFGIILFVMFFATLAISLDRESSTKQRALLLTLAPIAYFMFLAISLVEYSGLIKCLTRWKDVVYADSREKCSWIPVERKGANAIVG